MAILVTDMHFESAGAPLRGDIVASSQGKQVRMRTLIVMHKHIIDVYTSISDHERGRFASVLWLAGCSIRSGL
jgi:hypothetical protein